MKESLPTVSVCMTTYNHEAYIAQAIESVLAQQTSFAVELVVGEDGSTDRTGAICRDYAARHPERIRLVGGEVNLGMRANYRKTFEACRGKYVAYLDGDDWWCDPRKLQRQVEFMERESDCGMCCTDAVDFYPDSGRKQNYPPARYTDFDRLLLRTTVANCTTLARRDLIAAYYAEVHPEQHTDWMTEDWPMWLWFACRSRIELLKHPTAVHRRLPESGSHTSSHRKRIAFRDSLMEISLWFDARYAAGRNRHRILRERSGVALWILSWEGTLGEYLARWWDDVRTTPRLLLYPDGPGLLVKKILFRRKKREP